MNLVAIAGVPVGAEAPVPAESDYDRQTMWLSFGALGVGALVGYFFWRRR